MDEAMLHVMGRIADHLSEISETLRTMQINTTPQGYWSPLTAFNCAHLYPKGSGDPICVKCGYNPNSAAGG